MITSALVDSGAPQTAVAIMTSLSMNRRIGSLPVNSDRQAMDLLRNTTAQYDPSAAGGKFCPRPPIGGARYPGYLQNSAQEMRATPSPVPHSKRRGGQDQEGQQQGGGFWDIVCP